MAAFGVMETLELLVGLLAAVAVVVTLAGRTPIPEPVLLLGAGLAVALIPGLPQVELDPDLILALFLPPLLSKMTSTSTPSRTALYSQAGSVSSVS